MLLKFIKKNPVLFAILLVTFIVYLSTLNNAILKNWDDFKQILDNDSVKNLSFKNIKVYFSSYVLQSYQPLASFSFAIEYFFFKKTAAPYHFTNVAIHLFNIFLVFRILTQLFKENKYLILFTTAIFALHPLQVETVAWLSSRSTLLCSLFMLLSIHHYLKYLEIDRNKYFAYSIIFFVAGLFSKSTGIIIPGLLILLDIFLLRKFSKKLILEKIPFFAFAIIFGVISLKSREVESGLVSTVIQQLGYNNFIDRVMVSCYSYLFYFGKFIAPFDLYHLYGYPLRITVESLPLIYRISPFLVIIILAGMSWMLFKLKKNRIRNLFFGLAFYSINIFLVLNIVAVLAYITAERYMYLAIIGLAICLWTIIELVIERKASWKSAIYGVVFLFLGFQIIKTHRQIGIWKDSKTLFLHITNYYKANNFSNNSAYRAWQTLATMYNEEQNIPKVIECYKWAVKFKPDEPVLHIYKGYALSNLRRYREAIKDFSFVIENKIVRREEEALKLAYTNRAHCKNYLFDQVKNVRLLKSALIDIDSALVIDANQPKLIDTKREIINKIEELNK